MGPTAKIRSEAAFYNLKLFSIVGKAIGLHIFVIKTDGSQPLGVGIGPALEAKDILAVLQNKTDAPIDLKNKAIALAATILAFGKKISYSQGEKLAKQLLENGSALKNF